MQLVVFLLITFCAVAQARPEADVGVHDVFPGIGEYYFNGIPANWSTAFRQCQASGGNLAVINSVEEKEALQEMLTRHGASSVLIGFHDQFIESVYTFITGRSVATSSTSDSMWAPSYPVGSPLFNCGYLDVGGIFDGSCSALSPFICELSEDQGGEDNSDGFVLLDGFGYYKDHHEQKTWPEAWDICRGERSDLVVLHTEAELLALYAAFQPTLGVFWVGVHRRWGPDDGFVTVRNVPFSELGYQTWNPASEPWGTYETNPYVASLGTTGLAALGHNFSENFICERPLP